MNTCTERLFITSIITVDVTPFTGPSPSLPRSVDILPRLMACLSIDDRLTQTGPDRTGRASELIVV